jgi:flagella basal body P-ring formation protein FlgA
VIGLYIKNGIIICTIAASNLAYGASSDNGLLSLIRNAIVKSYANARVDLVGEVQWVRGAVPESPVSVSILGDDAKGNIHFSVYDSDSHVSEGWVGFLAWIPARVSTRRIRPGQPLTQDLFVTQDVNVSSGAAREYRGVILPEGTEIAGLESVQTILEGQFLTSSAVQRVPDIRRGDAVRVRLVSGGLTLTTMGIAEEPAYLHMRIRVTTGKSKKELLGNLEASGIVEVKL